MSDEVDVYKRDKLKDIQLLWEKLSKVKGDCIVDFRRSQNDLVLCFRVEEKGFLINIPTTPKIVNQGYEFEFTGPDSTCASKFRIARVRQAVRTSNGERIKIAAAVFSGCDSEMRDALRKVWCNTNYPEKIKPLATFPEQVQKVFDCAEKLGVYQTVYSVLLILGTHRGGGAFSNVPTDILKVICRFALDFGDYLFPK